MINQFNALSVRYSDETQEVFITDSLGYELKYSFIFKCKYGSSTLFFDMNKLDMIVVWTNPYGTMYSPNENFSVVITKFWIENDLPVPATRFFDKAFLNNVEIEFKEKLASYTLDNIINDIR